MIRKDEDREQAIRRMEAGGDLDPNCAMCRNLFYSHPKLDPFAPRHKAMPTCRSGKRPHCTCDTCF